MAAAAPPTDLVDNLTGGTDPAIEAFLTAFIASAWSRYFGIDLRTIVKPAGQRLITRLAQNCVVLDAPVKLRTKIGVLLLRRELKGVDLGRVQPWARLARENSAGRAAPGAPLFIAQTRDDPIVAPKVTRSFARAACGQGARLRYPTLPGGDHAHSARDSATQTLAWIAHRFAGRALPSDCGRL